MIDIKQQRTRRKMRSFLIGLALTCASVFVLNTSIFVKSDHDRPTLLAHRGLAQQFSKDGLTGDTCTAAQSLMTGHSYLENTLPSMQAAFDLGADIVEFDVHLTADNQFAVFHDWTLDCRTDGRGITREQTLDSLQKLDLGYGYTADGGRSYPFRGLGVGMMPSLEDVFDAFPERHFLIEIKSQVPAEGIQLAERLAELPPERLRRIMVYGGGQAVTEIRDRLPVTKTIWRARLKTCLVRYFALGWSGYVPAACERSVLTIPANYAPWLWGWPNRFVKRMEEAGSSVFVIGDYAGEGYSQGFDDPDRLLEFPADFAGGIWTDRIDLLGPTIRRD